MNRLLAKCLALLAISMTGSLAIALEGLVSDAATGRPVAGASLVACENLRRSDAAGRYDFGATCSDGVLSVKALGYARQIFGMSTSSNTSYSIKGKSIDFQLKTIRPKALYLSVYGIGSDLLREDALRVIDEAGMNALVIDIKGDRGLVPYRSAVMARSLAAAGLPPQKPITVADMPAMVQRLHERGLYLIARIVVFKDDPLVAMNPQWAVRNPQGGIWHDREDLAWIDPFRREAWEHSLAIAEEAAQLGFDEVQFDYLRFPDAKGLSFSQTNDQAGRVAAINGFLAAAQARLQRYNVFISADIFGYVAWNANDTQIGQQLEALAGQLDYLSLMLYPSGFSFGIPEHRDPVAAPFDIVEHSLRRALQRTGLPGWRFRPWLQAFRDYAFDHREFGPNEIRQQIEAAESLGTHGWMLWNPKNRYNAEGLKRPTAQP